MSVSETGLSADTVRRLSDDEIRDVRRRVGEAHEALAFSLVRDMLHVCNEAIARAEEWERQAATITQLQAAVRATENQSRFNFMTGNYEVEGVPMEHLWGLA